MGDDRVGDEGGGAGIDGSAEAEGADGSADADGGGATDAGLSMLIGAMPSSVLPMGSRLAATAGIGAVTAPG